MAEIISSYSEDNYVDESVIADNHPADGGSISSCGNYTVTVSKKSKLTSIKLYLKKANSPTANLVVRVYAESGGLPTGDALASSGAYASSSLTTSYQLIEFTFTGADQITLNTGTNYCISCEAAATGTIDGTNTVLSGRDNSSPTGGGGLLYYVSTGWASLATHKTIYYVYGEPITDRYLSTKSKFW